MSYYFTLPVNEDLGLAYCDVSMAQEIYECVISDKEHIGEFLDFAHRTTDISVQEEYIKMKLHNNAEGTDKMFCLIFEEAIIGCIDLHKINQKNQSAEIGYWIHSDYTKRGFITAVVKKICAYSFYGLHLNKLSIFADVANVASNKVALKCGFEFVGTDKAEILLRDELRDMNKYSLLKKDFQLE